MINGLAYAFHITVAKTEVARVAGTMRIIYCTRAYVVEHVTGARALLLSMF